MSTHKGIEVKKDGLSQLQDGCWVLKLKVHPEDMETSLMVAPMGTRYMAALVEIGDDEEPVIRPKEKFTLSQEAGMYCTKPKFWRFLSEEIAKVQISTTEMAAVIVRSECLVESRSQFNTDKDAAERWIEFRGKFKVWERFDATSPA